jgi:two-component system response regulator
MLAEAAHETVDILLVEDNPNDVQLTLHALKESGLTNRIRVVRDGAEALEFLFARRVDAPKVVMLDLKLPRVDGLEVLRTVKADPRMKTVPVVVLTSSGEVRDIARAYELGANSYLVKPVDFDDFTALIRHLGEYWVHLNQRAPVAPLPAEVPQA